MKKIFLSLALVVIPTLYASQYQENNKPTVIQLSPIIMRNQIDIPKGTAFLYNNPYKPEEQIYPTSILKCDKLTGEGTIYIDVANTLILQAHDMNEFIGCIYFHPFASLVIYTQTKKENINVYQKPSLEEK